MVLAEQLSELKGEMALLDDMPAAKRWLKRERSRLEAEELGLGLGMDIPF